MRSRNMQYNTCHYGEVNCLVTSSRGSTSYNHWPDCYLSQHITALSIEAGSFVPRAEFSRRAIYFQPKGQSQALLPVPAHRNLPQKWSIRTIAPTYVRSAKVVLCASDACTVPPKWSSTTNGLKAAKWPKSVAGCVRKAPLWTCSHRTSNRPQSSPIRLRRKIGRSLPPAWSNPPAPE